VPVFDQITAAGHEQVVFVADRSTGLRAIIAVHSTALGPALGGVRFWSYRDEDAALTDALRLSEAMTLKAAAAGLDQGGGKTVVLVDDPRAHRDEACLRVLGRAIDELGGRYIAAEDVGATPRDMNLIARETPWVTGVDPAVGGSGDPSPVTAIGVLHGIRAALQAAYGNPDPAGRVVAVQGVGHVGAHLVRLLHQAGADITIADVSEDRVRALVDELGVAATDPDSVLGLNCDVLVPCALGSVVRAATLDSFRCRVIAGAANNQLATLADGDGLHERGILYAPDFVVNAGGIINIAEEFVGYDHARAARRVAAIEETTSAVFRLAQERGTSPARAAEAFARERIERVGRLRSRWVAGTRTAWSAGAPLRRLRGPS
jgi:leucine dehydrogenase